MVSEKTSNDLVCKTAVLILVVVEYGLGEEKFQLLCQLPSVLILVVVEYGLGVLMHYNKIMILAVLILVVVEYGLGEEQCRYLCQ